MLKKEEKNFGFLGSDFQIALIKELIEDRKFSSAVIDVMDSKYFDGPYFRYIVENIKELYTTYSTIPTYSTIEQKIKVENSNDTTTFKIFIDTLQNIKDYNTKTQNSVFVKDTALNFCKQQVLRKELNKIEKIIDSGKFEDYNRIEGIIQKALQIGAKNDNDSTPFDDIEGTLQEESRIPVPTGILGLDNDFNGGLGIGEFGVVLAPTGIGKTTLLTYFANSGFNSGFNTWQIFFEDTERDINQKHYARWTGLSPREQRLKENKDVVIEKVLEISESKNTLLLSKYPSQTIRVSDIKNKLRKLRSEGIKMDLIVIDYIDCILPDRNIYDDDWKGEASIMRSLEAMTDEFDIAIWVATQGNRASMSTEIVTGDQTGGSIKKMQIGHVVLSVGKTIEQKQENVATMTLIKSRIGRDGIVYQNCPFNNEYMVIETSDENTLLGVREEREQRMAQRPHELYKKKLKDIEEKGFNNTSSLEKLKEEAKQKADDVINDNDENKNRAAELYKQHSGKTTNDEVSVVSDKRGGDLYKNASKIIN